MEAMVKKYQQRFRKVRDEMETWAELQSLLTSQFRNASSIIQRLQVLQDSNNYGEGLRGVAHLQEAVLLKQMESLQKLLLSMNNNLEQFHGIVLSLGRIHRDGRQMIKGGSSQLSFKQLQQRVGVKPSLADCVDGLMLLQDMHCSEYLLKSSLVSALSELTLKPSASDLGSLQQILIDQPNIPKEEGDASFTFNRVVDLHDMLGGDSNQTTMRTISDENARDRENDDEHASRWSTTAPMNTNFINSNPDLSSIMNLKTLAFNLKMRSVQELKSMEDIATRDAFTDIVHHDID